MLGKTEANNTANVRLFQSNEEVGLDSQQVSAVGLQKFTTLDSLPSSSLTSGQQAWVESSGRLYISNGSGWYNIALVNASPTLTLDQSGTIILDADTLSVTVTATATDADDNQNIITFSVESDGNMLATGTTLSQDSSVFTITAQSEDSGGTAGSFNLTFKATDQIAVDNESLSFTLQFSTTIDSSSNTIMLFKAKGDDGDNNAIKYVDSSDTDVGWIVSGEASSNSFSPFRPGGYSMHFDGTGDYLDYGTVAAIGNVGTSDFTYEAWFYNEDYNQANFPTLFAINSYTNGLLIRIDHTADNIDVYIANGITNATYTFEENKWYHIAVTRESGTVRMWINGVHQTLTGAANGGSITSGNIRIGTSNHNTAETWKGYITDVRFVNGTADFTGSSNISVPTERVAINGAELFTCHLPYLSDAAGNATPGVNGDPQLLPFGPYDYDIRDSASHGGSIYFGGEGHYLSHNVPSDIQTLGRQNQSMTIEAWVYPTGSPSNYAFIYGVGNHGTTGGSNLYGLEIGTSLQLRGAVNGAYTTATGMPQTANNVLTKHMWSHVALVQNAGDWTIYVNGVSKATQGNTSYMSGTTHTKGWAGRSHYDDNRYWLGHLSNLRIHDTAIYTAAFTPPTSPVTTPKLLLNKDGANPSIYDETSANGFTLQGGGSQVVSSIDQQKWSGSSSMYWNGGNASIHMDPGENIYDWGAVDAEGFTLEGWFYVLSGGDTNYTIIDTRTSASNGFWFTLASTGKRTNLYHNSAWAYQASSDEISYDTWTHIALTAKRSGTSKIFVGGSQVASWTAGNAALLNSGLINWGDVSYTPRDPGTNCFKGYWQDIRISRGYKYTSAFTPPTAEFQL